MTPHPWNTVMGFRPWDGWQAPRVHAVVRVANYWVRGKVKADQKIHSLIAQSRFADLTVHYFIFKFNYSKSLALPLLTCVFCCETWIWKKSTPFLNPFVCTSTYTIRSKICRLYRLCAFLCSTGLLFALFSKVSSIIALSKKPLLSPPAKTIVYWMSSLGAFTSGFAGLISQLWNSSQCQKKRTEKNQRASVTSYSP